ncbi:hypothetical protein CRG98_018333 [Punica granatum]|uniref:Uncharacterized protein n=1 Tax=Punica granatum TaxID=22663 RepID=A0A2I0JY56_PUNGR|nr:hypothetical protein CRG98_018333 [Punica granatum]
MDPRGQDRPERKLKAGMDPRGQDRPERKFKAGMDPRGQDRPERKFKAGIDPRHLLGDRVKSQNYVHKGNRRDLMGSSRLRIRRFDPIPGRVSSLESRREFACVGECRTTTRCSSMEKCCCSFVVEPTLSPNLCLGRKMCDNLAGCEARRMKSEYKYSWIILLDGVGVNGKRIFSTVHITQKDRSLGEDLFDDKGTVIFVRELPSRVRCDM